MKIKERDNDPTPRRIDLPCTMTGLSPPPYPVQIKVLRNNDQWRMVALTQPGKPPQIARWLETYDPVSIYIGTGISPRILRANFESLPGRWHQIVGAVNMQFAQLTPEDCASLFVEDTPLRVDRLLDLMDIRGPEVRARKAHMVEDQVVLTPRQLEVLSIAVALGYYEVPHKLNLRQLAAKLDLSVGAVSELLRRAEAQIITSYVDSTSNQRWSDAEAKAEPIKPMEPTGPFDPVGHLRQRA